MDSSIHSTFFTYKKLKEQILILLFITNSLFAQVQFEAKVSKNSLGLNERLRVDFTMNADGDNFAPPNFESCGFKVVGGPSQSVSQSWINGKSSFNKSYIYILLPTQKGSLTLKQASVEINGLAKITGGTGKYAGASGTLKVDGSFASKHPANGVTEKVDLTLTLSGSIATK